MSDQRNYQNESRSLSSYSTTKSSAGKPSGTQKTATPKKHNKNRIIVNVVLSVVLCISLIMGSMGYVLGYASFADKNIGEDGDVTASGSTDEAVSLKGSTNPNVTYFLVLGTDVENILTDIMMVVCFDHARGTASILQIPRDTFISSSVPSGKVNAVYGSSSGSKINGLIKCINDYFGLPIDHYINISIDCFREIVDAVGGIEVYFEKALHTWDKDADYYDFDAGWHLLNGKEAESFVRHRASYAMGDIGRVEAQRNFYAAFAKKLINMSYSDMAAVATSCYKDIKTDMTVGLLLGYAKAAQTLSLDNIIIEAAPGQSGYARPEGMSQKLSYYCVHKDEYVQLINAYFMPYDEEGISVDDLALQEIFDVTYDNVVENGGSFSEILNHDSDE